MKPSFALNFTDDSVSLLHRTKRGWLEVGRTAYDTPDLPEALGYMRSTALGLSPQGVATKLVIPPSQVRYFRIFAPGPTEAARRAQIATALEGRTPYGPDELAFDWSGHGDEVTVAVVARETLAEAEAFANEHRFAPVSFVTQPPADSAEGTFAGEPWFGVTEHASRVLSGAETVERDDEAITVLSRALPSGRSAAPAEPDPREPEPAPPEPEPEPEPLPEPEPEPEPETEPETEPDPEPAPVTEPDPAPAPEPLPVPEPLPATVPAPAPELPEPEPLGVPQPDVAPEPADPDPMPAPSEMPAFDPIDVPDTMGAASRTADEAPAPTEAEPITAEADADEAPIALDVEDDDPIVAAPFAPAAPRDIASAQVTTNALMPSDDDKADIPGGVFASRRSPALASATASAAAGIARRLGAASRLALQPAARPAPAKPPAKPRTPPKLGYPDLPDSAAPQRSAALGGAQPPATPSVGTTPTLAPPAPAAQLLAAAANAEVQAQPSPNAPPTAPPKPAPPVPRPAGAGAKPKSAKPASFGTAQGNVRGKPRYLGFVLTGILLVMLALAAALSKIYVAQSTVPEPASQSTELASADNAAPDPTVPADATDPSIADEMLADGQDVETADDGGDDGGAVTAADLGVTPDTGTAPTTADAVPAMQPAATGGDEIILSSADSAPAAVDAAALPLPEARGDPAPDAPLPPPAFGTVYQFDEDGLVRPTPEGITTPEGVLLVAGKPPLVPPPRPAGLAPATPEGAATGADPADRTDATPTNPALIGKRPQARPAGFAAAPVADPDADLAASLVAQPDSRLATLRPQARPADLAPAQDGTLALVAPDGAITPLGGLDLSPRPVARPDAMADAVAAAVAAAASAPIPDAPIPDAPLVDDGNVTPETEQEPEIASAAPSIPTKANVAKEATVRNALNLGKINLIGVYGTQSNRYALVRQPNGRIVKVSAGDRLDGGRVAAVTATELRYEKRGQMLVLSMPRG